MRPLPTLLALTAAAAFGGFAATALHQTFDQPAQAAPPPVSAPVQPVAALPASVPGQIATPSLAPMLKRVMPAVVSVHTKQVVRVSAGPFGNDPFFRRMFPDLTQERINESLGSGVIIDAEHGYVLTNHHVIDGADDVSVTLADGRTLEAEFIGSDADTDVALMRIPAQALTEIPLADSSRLQVGDFVVAIGNPFGLSQTVTSGIVSAVGRSGIPMAGFQNFIQTDASINPGNSGGALVDLDGRLVGINSATFNPQGSRAGAIGLGFAIPSNLASNVMQQLLSTGEVRRGTLGLESQNVDARLAQALGLDTPRGALVTRIYPGSAAATAGLQVGDVVLSANGQRIDNAAALHNFEGLQAVGSAVRLDVRRDGKPLQLNAKLKESVRQLGGANLDPRLTGATFRELDESERQRLRSRGAAGGVQVLQVERGSRAEQNGLQSGDIVLAASSGEFGDLAGFQAGFQKKPEQLVLRIWRAGRTGNLIMQ
ncbi:heat-shock protein [Pseudoxanthomonas kalamensis DSM 18571]|uniref:Do family serine endopeptidase n=1 Tax=Pseudoxanthomonas kalamensis TaxID=289483 RepID=UPI00139121D5|nr:Do family serine endopeptidase [Pseudoxanthomonas kalamensis]KAF1711489.1 heat-shock protein [Pseudoxanthomonas kalamensis DSM 18571]